MDDTAARGLRPFGSDVPNGARIYDCLLGGSYNFAVDREVVDDLIKALPNVAMIVQSNREFLRRAVRYFLRRGIHQFLDLGSGVPTVGNVHAVAQNIDPNARVVYVEIEPIATESTRAMLSTNERADIVQADFRDPDAVLAAEPTRRLLDFSHPVALMATASLHHIGTGEGLSGIVSGFLSAMRAGGCFALSHFTGEGLPGLAALARGVFAKNGLPMIGRTRAEIEELLADLRLDLVDPGVVYAPMWRPEGNERFGSRPRASMTYAAVGCKNISA